MTKSPDSRTQRSRIPSLESLEALTSGDKVRMQSLVFQCIDACRERGAIVDEVSAALGADVRQVAPRVHELWKTGLLLKVIDADGEPVRRETRFGCFARVYICSEFARPRSDSISAPDQPPRLRGVALEPTRRSIARECSIGGTPSLPQQESTAREVQAESLFDLTPVHRDLG